MGNILRQKHEGFVNRPGPAADVPHLVMLQCKKVLAIRRGGDYFVHRSMSITIVAAFLDVSSLNLAVPQGIATFFGESRRKIYPSKKPLSAISSAISCVNRAFTVVNPASRSMRCSSI